MNFGILKSSLFMSLALPTVIWSFCLSSHSDTNKILWMQIRNQKTRGYMLVFYMQLSFYSLEGKL